jgi:hypothetical protein
MCINNAGFILPHSKISHNRLKLMLCKNSYTWTVVAVIKLITVRRAIQYIAVVLGIQRTEPHRNCRAQPFNACENEYETSTYNIARHNVMI